MKTLKMLTFISCVMVIIACDTNKNPELSGVYANQAQSEYSVASDTLIITAVSLADKSYTVERKTGFQKNQGTGRNYRKNIIRKNCRRSGTRISKYCRKPNMAGRSACLAVNLGTVKKRCLSES